MGFRDFRSSRSRNTGGAFKGPYKSESSQITCEAVLHGSVTRMVYSILSLIGRWHRPQPLYPTGRELLLFLGNSRRKLCLKRHWVTCGSSNGHACRHGANGVHLSILLWIPGRITVHTAFSDGPPEDELFFSPTIFHFFPTTGLFFHNPSHIFPIFYV